MEEIEYYSWAEIKEASDQFDRSLAESVAKFNSDLAASAAKFSRALTESSASFSNDLAAIAAEFDGKMTEGDRERVVCPAEFDRNLAARAAEFDRAQTARAVKSDSDLVELMGLVMKGAISVYGSAEKSTKESISNALKERLTFAGIRLDDVYEKMGGMTRMPDGTWLHDRFDITLFSDDDESIVLIEVPYKFRNEKAGKEDVESFVAQKKAENFRAMFPYYGDCRIYLALGGVAFDEGAIAAAKEHGIGLLRQVGETAEEVGSWEVTAR